MKVNRYYVCTIASLFLLLLGTFGTLSAQEVTRRIYSVDVKEKGITYFLPKTRIVITLHAEEVLFTPGCYARYAELLLGRKATEQASKENKLTLAEIATEGIVNEEEIYTVEFRPQTASSYLSLTREGILAAINAPPAILPTKSETDYTQELQTKETKIDPVFPAEYGFATSEAKRAEIAAQTLFDLKENLQLLISGKAENAPHEGEAFRLMVSTLQSQIASIEALFYGTESTHKYIKRFRVLPDKATTPLALTRFSKENGFIGTEMHRGELITLRYSSIMEAVLSPEEEKDLSKLKGIIYNVPGQAQVSLYQSDRLIAEKEFVLTQFGTKRSLSMRMGRSRNSNLAVQFDITTGALIDIREATEQ